MSVLKYKDALGNWQEINTIKGDQGATGAQGAQGIPGVSPTIAVSDITGGHRVTITDADHPGGISFDVMDGSDADATPLYTALDYGTKTVNIIEYAMKYSNYWLNANGELVTASNYTSYEFDYDGTYTKFDATLYSNTFSGKAIAFVDGSGSVISTVGYTTTSGGSVYTDQPVPTGTKKIRLSNRHGGQNSGTAVASYVADTSGRIVGIEQELNHMPSDVLVADSSVVNNGVAKIPKGTNSILGAVRGRADRGISIEDGITYIKAATSEEMKAERNAYNPIVPDRQHISAYYALSKLAGVDLANETVTLGTYPDASKSAIQNLIGGAISVTGTTPTINALPGLRYICGEVSTLTVNLPASGCVDIQFESGSTPTVLTVNPASGQTVTFPVWFDDENLEADTVYEMSFADGYGAVMSWAT